jgi:hypothetical protein
LTLYGESDASETAKRVSDLPGDVLESLVLNDFYIKNLLHATPDACHAPRKPYFEACDSVKGFVDDVPNMC